MLKKIKVSYKIVLMICAVALPLVAATIFASIKGFNKDINFALQEKKGIVFQRPVMALLQALPQHHWMADAARQQPNARITLAEKEAEIDNLFGEVELTYAKLANDLQFNDEALAKRKRQGCDSRSVKASWVKLKQNQATLTAEQSASEHQQIIAALRTMITHAGDASKLTLDPDLDSSYLAHVTLQTLPNTIDQLARVADVGQRVLRRDRSKISAQELAQFATLTTQLEANDLEKLNSELATVLSEDAAFNGASDSLQKNLPESLKTFKAATDEFIQLAHTASTEAASVTAARLIDSCQQARNAGLALWKVSADELDSMLQARANTVLTTRALTLAGVAFALVLSVVVAFFVSRSITKPLSGLAHATKRIIKGDTTVRAPVDSEDEIGELATSFNTMLDYRLKAQSNIESENRRLQSSIQELLTVVSDASDGKLGVRAKVSEGALGNVGDALNLMLENVGELIMNAKNASDQVASAASEISEVAHQLENGEKRQTEEIFVTSEGVRDLNGQAQTVLKNCQSATSAADKARRAAEQGAKAVREVIRGMDKIRENTQANAKKIKRLGDRSMEIAGIVKVISDISAKTDMLALNASIEAARAGEQGRGFTVVAEQVRGLADRTKTLTAQIDKLVNDIQKETAEAVAQMETQTQEVEAGAKAAQSAGGTLENIVSVSAESSELVSQINKAATHQAARTHEIFQNVNTINTVVTQSAEKVRETRSTSEQLLILSAELNKRLSQFELETVA